MEEEKLCKRCQKPIDRKGQICKLCKQKSLIYTNIRQQEENKQLKKEFKEELPYLIEEIRKKVLKELDEEDKEI